MNLWPQWPCYTRSAPKAGPRDLRRSSFHKDTAHLAAWLVLGPQQKVICLVGAKQRNPRKSKTTKKEQNKKLILGKTADVPCRLGTEVRTIRKHRLEASTLSNACRRAGSHSSSSQTSGAQRCPVVCQAVSSRHCIRSPRRRFSSLSCPFCRCVPAFRERRLAQMLLPAGD